MPDLSQDLLRWYDAHRRALPWRDEVSPWRTLVSELMLQQTRVETVLPYFERFMARWPTPQALAADPLDALNHVWSGLGYYSRARNLYAAATAITAAGGFPTTVEGLRALPGVGPYTAGAIASIALGLDEVAVDGNLERVLARIHRYAGPRDGVVPLARQHLPPGRAGDYNQSLMDLGATICTPREPACGRCPVASHCQAFQHQEVDRYPVKVPKKASPEVRGVAAVIRRGAQVLLARRPETGLLGGLYELPGLDPVPDGVDLGQALAGALEERLGLQIAPTQALGTVRHIFTHRKLSLVVFDVHWLGTPTLQAWYTAMVWADPQDPGALGLSTLARKALDLLTPARQAALF